MKSWFKRNMWVCAVCAALCVLWPAEGYAQDAGGKLGRGLAGMVAGWVELPGNIYAEGSKNGFFAGITVGFAKGIGMTVARTLVGVYEFITFPIPAPDEYNPILMPEFPWDYFSGEGQVVVPAATSQR